MANKNIGIEKILEEEALQVYSGMTVVWPQYGSEEALNLEQHPKFPGRYAMNNSTVCAVTFEGKIFVAPYTRIMMDALNAAGFISANFYVPFSNWDYPKFEKEKWEALQNKANEARKQAFIYDCNEYCDKHGIGEISDETLKNCFQMPAEGVAVKHIYFDNTYYPQLNTTCLDYVAIEKLGKFCGNNGRVVFVYRDGKTYVTKGYRIMEELRMAGYEEAGLFVPFSNGETIQDPILKARWDEITK